MLSLNLLSLQLINFIPQRKIIISLGVFLKPSVIPFMQISDIERIEQEFSDDIHKVSTETELEQIRIKYLSRNGIITKLFDDLKTLSGEEKPVFGKLLNNLRNNANQLFSDQKSIFESKSISGSANLDLTLPGKTIKLGSRHILTQTLSEIKSIFKGLGFSVYDGPELESDYYNFEALNFPPDHPARDMQDTFLSPINFYFAHTLLRCRSGLWKKKVLLSEQ